MQARPMLKRLALVPFGLLLFLLVLEAGLQVAAFLAQRSVRAGQPVAAGSGDLRILCVGDSNTYGLYVERDETYPARLELLWNATHDSPKLDVMNLGMPGTNSWWLLREFDRMLDTFSPDLVLVLVGANDFWTQPPPEGGETSDEAGGLLRRSRVVKALYMAWRSRDAREIEVQNKEPGLEFREPVGVEALQERGGGGYTARYGGETFEMDFTMRTEASSDSRRDADSLRRNLETLAGRAAAAGSQLVLLTYAAPMHFYEASGVPIREAAQATRSPLVDVAAAFRPRCPRAPCPDLLFSDGHPTAEGYHLVAEAVVRWLSEYLAGGPPAERDAR